MGRLTRAYVDSSRTDWLGTGPRPLAATVWYPAAAGSPEEEWTVGVFRFGRSARDASFADDTRRPLIVLSHGTGGSVAQLAWLAEALAAEGFMVAGVNHHGNTAAESTQHPAGFVLPWERAHDLSVLLDRLLADPDIGTRVDTTRIAAAGFSLGGYSVLALAGARVNFAEWQQQCAASPDAPSCVLPPEAAFTLADVDALARTDAPFQAGVARNARDPGDGRVRAVYAMAPALVPLLDTLSLHRLAVPLRVVLGDRDAQVSASATAEVFTRHQPRAALHVLAGVAHYAFLAECSWRGQLFMRAVCSDGGAGRSALHAVVIADALSYFEQQLRDAPSAVAAPDAGGAAPPSTRETGALQAPL